MKKALLVLVLIASVATSGWATALDLSTSTNSGTINGAVFVFDKQQPTGSGVLHSFLRIQGNGPPDTENEHGYKFTDAANNQLPFDDKGGAFTHSVLFSSLEATNDGYYLFVLDIGEPNNSPNSLLSLDGLKFFSTTLANKAQHGTSTDANGDANGIIGTLLYNMDLGADSYVLLDANRGGHPGNGVSDMLLKIPTSDFANRGAGEDYLILWSRFGLQAGTIAGSGADGTYEEWASVTGEGGGGGGGTPVPEPGTVLMLGSGLVGLALFGRKRRSR